MSQLLGNCLDSKSKNGGIDLLGVVKDMGSSFSFKKPAKRLKKIKRKTKRFEIPLKEEIEYIRRYDEIEFEL